MSWQGIVLRQLGCDLLSSPRAQAFSLRKMRALGELALRIGTQLLTLFLDQRFLAIFLATNRHVLTEGDQHGTADNGGCSGKENGSDGVHDAGNPYYRGRRRHDCIIDSLHRCP